MASVPVSDGGGTIYSVILGGESDTPALGAVPAGWNNPDPAKMLDQGKDGVLKSGFNLDGADVQGTISNVDLLGEMINVAIGDG